MGTPIGDHHLFILSFINDQAVLAKDEAYLDFYVKEVYREVAKLACRGVTIW